jgi:hypothetical protein
MRGWVRLPKVTALWAEGHVACLWLGSDWIWRDLIILLEILCFSTDFLLEAWLNVYYFFLSDFTGRLFWIYEHQYILKNIS